MPKAKVEVRAPKSDWLALAKKMADMHDDFADQLDKVPEHMRHAFSEMEKLTRYMQTQLERDQ